MNGGLEFMEQDLVLHRLQLDNYRPDLTEYLMTFERGFNRTWNPVWQIAVYPQGLDGTGRLLDVMLGHRRLSFRPVKGVDGTVSLVYQGLKGLGDFSLARDGSQLVLEGRKKRWSFATYDGGFTFQIERIQSLERPRDFVVMLYTGSNLTEMQFADGGRTILEYDEDLVAKITNPGGRYIRFHRDDYGWVDEIAIFHPDHTVEREVVHVLDRSKGDGIWETREWWVDGNTESGTLTHRYRYQNDARGRIMAFRDNCGELYVLTYTHATTDKGELYTVIETHESTGDYRYTNCSKIVQTIYEA